MISISAQHRESTKKGEINSKSVSKDKNRHNNDELTRAFKTLIFYSRQLFQTQQSCGFAKSTVQAPYKYSESTEQALLEPYYWYPISYYLLPITV